MFNRYVTTPKKQTPAGFVKKKCHHRRRRRHLRVCVCVYRSWKWSENWYADVITQFPIRRQIPKAEPAGALPTRHCASFAQVIDHFRPTWHLHYTSTMIRYLWLLMACCRATNVVHSVRFFASRRVEIRNKYINKRWLNEVKWMGSTTEC